MPSRPTPPVAVAGHELAPLPAGDARFRSACAEPHAQLFDFAPHRFFGQRRFIDVGAAVEIRVPLRTNLLGRDFRNHRGEVCGKAVVQRKFGLIVRGLQRVAQWLVLLAVGRHLTDRRTVKLIG